MRYIITHGHIFKNAGSTFDFSLEKAFGKDFCDHRDDLDMRRGGANYLEQFILDNPSVKAISSHHLCNPLPISESFKCIPIYFVRNPIERIISVYNFEKKQSPKASLGAKMASKLSLIDYVKWRMSLEAPMVIRNYQTAYIGDEKKMASPMVSYDTFKKALDRIYSDEILVGTVERFDESFKQITQKLETFFPEIAFSYKNKNVNNHNSVENKFEAAVKLLEPVLGDVIDNNAYDLALFKAVNEKLG